MRQSPSPMRDSLHSSRFTFLFTLRTSFILGCFCIAASGAVQAAPPHPPLDLRAIDTPWDSGNSIELSFSRSSNDPAGPSDRDIASIVAYHVLRSGEPQGESHEVAQHVSDPESAAAESLRITLQISNCEPGKPYWFRVYAITAGGERSTYAETSGTATRQWFDGRRAWFAVMMATICGAVVCYVFAARRGVKLSIRKIAGLDAIADAVGRATEMGQACLFVPGVQDINEIQTIAGLTILGRVAEKAAEYDCDLVVPTSRSLVMTAARETVAAAFYAAGRPDAFNEDRIYYVTDEQFGYVAHLTGVMVREKPAACFYLGAFFAESLILSETGNSVGAIQIAGTAQPAQLPFFVAACDYTLIGEEFFAASAYLSGDPDQLGSLKGQDVGKLIVALLVIVGAALSTAATYRPDWTGIRSAETFLLHRVLGEG